MEVPEGKEKVTPSVKCQLDTSTAEPELLYNSMYSSVSAPLGGGLNMISVMTIWACATNTRKKKQVRVRIDFFMLESFAVG